MFFCIEVCLVSFSLRRRQLADFSIVWKNYSIICHRRHRLVRWWGARLMLHVGLPKNAIVRRGMRRFCRRDDALRLFFSSSILY